MNPLPRGKIRFEDLYKWAGVIHQDVGAMALGDLILAVRGLSEANGAKPKGNGNMSEDRLSELGIAGF